MRHNFLDRHANLDSPLHALEARAKLIGILALIIAILNVPVERGSVLLVYFFFTAVLAGISQIPLSFVVLRSLAIVPFVVLAGLAAPWHGGFDAAWLRLLFLRSLLCLVLLVLLTNTTPFPELLRALRRLGCPRILVLNLGFLYRYLFVLTEEVLRMRQARDSRRTGRAPIVSELRLLAAMLGTLMLRSFERAERMYQAMLARGFAGEFPVLAPRRFSIRDVIFLGLVALLVGGPAFL